MTRSRCTLWMALVRFFLCSTQIANNVNIEAEWNCLNSLTQKCIADRSILKKYQTSNWPQFKALLRSEWNAKSVFFTVHAYVFKLMHIYASTKAFMVFPIENASWWTFQCFSLKKNSKKVRKLHFCCENLTVRFLNSFQEQTQRKSCAMKAFIQIKHWILSLWA